MLSTRNLPVATAAAESGMVSVTITSSKHEAAMRSTAGPDSTAWVAAASNEGRLLMFPLADLPQLARGKGNKIIGIPSARVQSRDEFMVGVQVLTEQDSLVVVAGKRHIKLKFSELEHYRGERGRRGNKLPRGFQKVDAIRVER